jgi:hypothetical protein
MEALKIGSKFVACWGYDQTQYSIYEVAKISGKSVLVRGLNGWSNLDARDLAPGSQVKIYRFTKWDDLTDEERADWSSRGFDRWNYERHNRDAAIEKAETRTIVKMNRVNGQSWTYLWVLDDGSVYDSTEDWKTRADVKIVDAMKKCLVQHSSYNDKMNIKIDDVIRAYHDPEYDTNANRYAEQNEYTAYNGR